MGGVLLRIALVLGVALWSLVKLLRFVSRFDNRFGVLARDMLRSIEEFGRSFGRAIFWALVLFLIVTISRMTIMRFQTAGSKRPATPAPASGVGR